MALGVYKKLPQRIGGGLRGILRACAVISCLIPIPLKIVSPPQGATGGKHVPNSIALFSEPQLVARVAYSSAGLTYIPSDLGPDSAVLPGPVFMSPALGLYLIDPGADSSTWRLLHIDPSGKIEYSENLVDKLNLKAAREFVPVAIHADSAGKLKLVASRRFDFVRQSQRDFFLAFFSPDGALTGLRTLTDFGFDGSLIFLGDADIVNREKKDKTPKWFLYAETGGRRELCSAGADGSAVRIRKQIVELAPDGGFEALAEDGHKIKLRLRGSAPQGEPVAGEGLIFGSISYGPIQEAQKPDEFLQRRTLQLLALEAESQTIFSVGSSTPLRPNISSTASPDFVRYRRGQSRFDVQGNLFEIAWGSDSLDIYRYTLNRAQYDKLLSALKPAAP